MAEFRRQTLSLVHRVRPPIVAPAAGRPPLLLLLHGVGSNELSMAAVAGSFDPRFLVISARAPHALEPFAFAWLHEVATSDGLVVDPGELAAASATVARFLDEAIDAYGADRDRAFVAGFSQGGIAALATMLVAPETPAAAVSMSGRLPPELVPIAAPRERLQGKPVLLLHGRDDEILGVAEGRRAYETLKELSLAVDYAELDIGHTTTEESRARVSAWLSARLGP